MPERARVPVFVRRCVRAVAAKGGDVSRAFAICVGQGQKQGLLKAGSLTATAKGRKTSKRKSSETGAGAKADEYETLLAAVRSDTSTPTESLRLLCAAGFMLLEEEGDAPAGEEGAEEADPFAPLEDEISGDLNVLVTMPVGKASDDTRSAVLKLLKRYKDNFQGGLHGASGWTVRTMRVRYNSREQQVEFDIWVNILKYVGVRVMSDLVQQVSDAALELSRSMSPKDVSTMIGHVVPTEVLAEPVDFVQAA